LNGGDLSGAPSVRLELSPSRRFAAAVVVVHAAAAACVLAVLTGWQGFALAVLLPALGVLSAWDRALLRGTRSPKTIEIRGSGKAVLRFADGRTAAVEPVRGIGLNRYWVALKCGAPARRGVLVTAGMLRPEPFRLLRLWALWGKLPGVASRQHTP